MAVEHSTVDLLLAVGAIASPVVGGFMLFLADRLYRRRDDHLEEQAKQGDRLNCHTAEIRHLQRETQTQPFDPKWDR